MQLTNFELQGPTVIEMYRLYKEPNGKRKLMITPNAMTVVSRDFLLSLWTQTPKATFKIPFLKIPDILQHLQRQEFRDVTWEAEWYCPLILSELNVGSCYHRLEMLVGQLYCLQLQANVTQSLPVSVFAYSCLLIPSKRDLLVERLLRAYGKTNRRNVHIHDPIGFELTILY